MHKDVPNAEGKVVICICSIEETIMNIDVKLQRERNHNQIQSTVYYIQKFYQNTITLNELAVIAYMSRYHFSRAFKKRTGISPIRYLTFYRINRAINLLTNTHQSITRISDLSGFNSPSHFAKLFKQETGVTPSYCRSHAKTLKEQHCCSS